MKLISYKAFGPRSTILDKLIGICTFSKYSHSELVFEEGCFSISPRENTVRIKKFPIDPEQWDQIDLGISKEQENKIFKHCLALIKCNFKYDYTGALSSTTPLCIQDNNKYFCSELCAEILDDFLDLEPSCKYSPGKLRTKIYNIEKEKDGH